MMRTIPTAKRDELLELMNAVERDLLMRRCFFPSERGRENARRRLLLSLDLHHLLYETLG